MKNYSCAIFDVDGTILDSMSVWQKVDEIFFSRHGLALTNDYSKKISTMGFVAAAEYTVKTFEINKTASQVIKEWNEIAEEEYKNDVMLKPHVKEYLKFIYNRNVKICIATASDPNIFVPALKRHGIYDMFENTTTLNEVKKQKGFPDIYFKAAEKNNSDVENCIVFEDLFVCVKAAKAGGFFTVGVADEHSITDRVKIKAASDIFIDDYKELI